MKVCASKITISVYRLMELIPDEDSARIYLELRRWNGNPECPHCKSTSTQYKEKRKGVEGYYRCRDCRKVYTVRTGTIFERSHVPLNKWMFAFYQIVTARKGISSMQLSKEIGVTQKTAWFLLQRIRAVSEDDNIYKILIGVVEADETYLGGIESNKHQSKKLKAGRGPVGKTPVMGLRQRDGDVKALLIPNTQSKTIQKIVKDTVCTGSTLYTDEHRAYIGITDYNHKSVCHSAKQYVEGKAHTNGIESVWAILKRAYMGVFHHFSLKHTQLYLNEVCFRLNAGNVKIPTLDRIDSLIEMTIGKRLTWKTLTA